MPTPMGGGARVFWAAHPPRSLAAAVAAARFTVDHVEVRPPQADEIAANRIYVAASRAAEP